MTSSKLSPKASTELRAQDLDVKGIGLVGFGVLVL